MKKITRNNLSSYIIIIINRYGFFNKNIKKEDACDILLKNKFYVTLSTNSHPYIIKSARILSLIQP